MKQYPLLILALVMTLAAVAMTFAVQGRPAAAQAAAQYVGSARCSSCHMDVYQRWSKTRMAIMALVRLSSVTL